MLCEKCKKKTATVHIKKSINGKKMEMYLCQDCARDYDDLFSNPSSMFDSLYTPNLSNTHAPSRVCHTCGMTAHEFATKGYLGCSDCYEAFASMVASMISRVQPASTHVGRKLGENIKSAEVSETTPTAESQIESLKLQLKEAIDQEDYLKAASIRDQIRALSTGEGQI